MVVIDWKKALAECGDVEFLTEILGDLVKEAHEAKQQIETAIYYNNFEGVKDAGHRVKGSASYLTCENLRSVSEKLQEAGAAGMTLGQSPSEASYLMNVIKGLFRDYCTALDQLELEISTNCPTTNN